MNVPTGVKVIFDGGSFNGVLPSLCELKNAPVLVGSGEGVEMTFQEGASLAEGSDLELSGGSVAITTATIAGALELSNVALTITTSLTVSGSLDAIGSGALSAPTLVKSGSGAIEISCGAASGTTWNVTTLEADSIDIASLTASGDVDSGDYAEGTTWNVGGNLTVGGSFDVPTLTLNGASTVPLENVENLTLGADAALTVSENSTIISLTSLGGSAILFSQTSLSVAESASLSSPTTLSGVGYLALPTGSDETALISASGSDVRVCEYGAGVTRLDAVVSADLLSLTGTATRTDATKTFLVEKKVDGVWTLVAAKSTGTFATATTGRNTELRTFDGVAFLTTTVYANAPRVWLVYVNATATQAVKPWNITTDYAFQATWTITTDYVMASDYNYAGESILLFARLEFSGSSTLVTSADVASIKYTCYKRAYSWGKETRTAVTGHSNVSIPLNTILDSLVTNDARWTKDSTGYNFRFEPDTTANPIFPESGEYIIVITITPTSGNPAPICYEITVN